MFSTTKPKKLNIEDSDDKTNISTQITSEEKNIKIQLEELANEEIRIKMAELELRKKKLAYETKKFEEKTKNELIIDNYIKNNIRKTTKNLSISKDYLLNNFKRTKLEKSSEKILIKKMCEQYGEPTLICNVEYWLNIEIINEDGSPCGIPPEYYDPIQQFIHSRIIKKNNTNSSIKKKLLLYEFTDWFKQEYGQRKIPKSEELYEYMNKKFGMPNSNKGWIGLEFIRDDEEGDDMMI